MMLGRGVGAEKAGLKKDDNPMSAEKNLSGFFIGRIVVARREDFSRFQRFTTSPEKS